MEVNELGESKMKIKEVTVIQDQGFFTHSTGDTYDGFFEAKKKDMVIKMHGPGVYKTAEGDLYTGSWENDRFGGANQEITITYADSSRYEGSCANWCYTGPGKYYYPDSSTLQGTFVENCPTGNLTLTDPNGHTWLGRSEQGFAWFAPVNHYFAILDKGRRTSKNPVKRHKDTTEH